MLFNVIREIRHLIKTTQVSTKKELTVHLSHADGTIQTLLRDHAPLIRSLTKLAHVSIQASPAMITGPQSQSVASTIDIQLELPDIDVAAEKARLQKQLDQLSNQQAALSRKLDNQQFIAKAPAAVVSKVKQEFSDIASEIKSIETQIATFN